MNKYRIVEGLALASSIAAGAGLAAGAVVLTRGNTRGAPGFTRAFSRLGRSVGGSMMTGVTLVGGSAALAGVAVYSSLKQLDRAY